MPVSKLDTNFVGCFLVFYLTIPFWNILIHNINRRQHMLLIVLLLICYTVLGSLPGFVVTFNYVSWFGVIYLIASYLRLYPYPLFERKRIWGWMSLICLTIAFASILIYRYYFVVDCNKVLALLVALCLFLWFKSMNIKYNKIINAFGAGTFGVLLIHANSDAMRVWLWKDTVDVVGHYNQPLFELMLFSIGVVLAVYIICNLIDQVRIATIEKWFMKLYDTKIAYKLDFVINKFLQKQ